MKKTGFSFLFAMIAIVVSASAAFVAFKVYPNPFRPSQGHTSVHFEGITGGGSINIYNTAGRLVFEKAIDPGSTTTSPAPGPGFSWNVKNNGGSDVASGMYIYFIETSGEEKTGKLGIIR